MLATVRSRAQGGLWRHGPAAAAELLGAFGAAGAAWLDVEREVAEHLGAVGEGVSLLASAHGGEEVDVAWAVDDGRFARVKLARPCDDARSFLRLLAEARAAPAHQFCVPYGKLAATRTLFAHGRALLFGAASADAPAAPGQPTLDLLLAELRAGEVTLDADLYGLVGNPPARSPSPALHNAWFRAAGHDALYVPLPGVPLDEAMGLPFEGFSITTPFKQAAYPMADEHDEHAQATGVANTLVRDGGGWYAENTDVNALRGALLGASMRAKAEERTGAVFIYGAGGYARAAIVAAREEDLHVRVAARRERAAIDLAASFDVVFAGGDRYERQPDDVAVVNTTPAGADGGPVEAFADADLAGLDVLDAPYAADSARTGLVAQAEKQGARHVVDGRGLLVTQGFLQNMTFGVAARQEQEAEPDGPTDLDRKAAVLLDPPTLVLVGPRGAGKSTIGRAVARGAGRPFVDTDDEVARITGRTPGRWIAEDGWEAFRAAEHAALERALARAGVVVATGGGCVEEETSRALLDAAPCVLFLDVPPEVAAVRMRDDDVERPPRPGASDPHDEARQADADRRPHWDAVSAGRVDAARRVEDVARDVTTWWREQDTMKL